MSIKTISLKLKCSESEQNLIIDSLKVKRDCFNHLSKRMFENNDWKGKTNPFKIQKKYYYELKEVFPKILTEVIVKTVREVVATYKTIKSNKHKIDSAPQQKNLSLQLDKRLYSRMTNESISVPSLKNTKRIKCEYVLYKRAKDSLNNYTAHDPKIYIKNNELYIAIPFEIPAPLPTDNEEALGIDLGIRCLASCSDGRVFQCRDFKETKRRLKYNQRQLQQKNTKSSRKHLKKIKRKIYNYSKNYIHHLTNEILRTDKNNIVVEDLKKIKEKTKQTKNGFKRTNHNRSFGDIPIYMIQSYLSYKASIHGKRMVKVSPAYTSQKDCRGRAVGTRAGRRYYCCDGVQLDADINASVNIGNGLKDSKHPISYPERVTYIGRLLSTNQSSLV